MDPETLEESYPDTYLRNADKLEYPKAEFKACSQIDQTSVALVGSKSWIVQLASRTDILDIQKNSNLDKNMYVNYFWRARLEMSQALDQELFQFDLIWIGLEYKVLVLGSTQSSSLYLTSFFLETQYDQKAY